jgi:hypothetical protein
VGVLLAATVGMGLPGCTGDALQSGSSAKMEGARSSTALRPGTPPGTGLPRPTAPTAPTTPGAPKEHAPGDTQAAFAQVAAARLLHARGRAVQARDKAAWMATVDDPASSFGRRQSLMFDNLMLLPDAGFSYDDPVPAPALTRARARVIGGPQTWVGQSQGHYALAGFDRAPRTFAVTFTFVLRPDGWRVADDTDGPTTRQVWDLPGLRVVRGVTSLVVGNDSPAHMRSYRDQADAGVARVTAVWGPRWSSHVVLVTPATAAQFAALLGRTGDRGLDQVAAVTEGSTVPGARSGGDRVVINPTTFGDLRPEGRRVVITHELTHVAVRSSTTRAAPLWLSEGLADYVGYLDLGLPRSRVAAPLLARVRAGTAPRRLPTDADFDPARTRIAPAYAAAWLACSRLADRYGQSRLVAFYRAVAGPDPAAAPAADHGTPDAETARAFGSVLGTTQQAFVSSWLSYVTELGRS